MANRSYIYALKDGKHISLGEAPYKIPYAYELLAAYDNRATESDLFDKNVGIRADFKKGKQALYSLLDFLVQTGEMADHEEFVAEVAKTKAFFDPIDADEILLENGEIYALYTDKEGNYLDGPGMEKANEWEREDAQWVGEDVNNLTAFGIQPQQLFHMTDEKVRDLFKTMLDLQHTWKEKMGLDTWRSILYFQFNEN
ncbi:MAG: hypothetical protein K0R65_2010 [Crocinitomicaceae bacterium]|jgi:hypothetical protein|nr:hypothetical protein [Crocinitomicaceae bacterium]